MSVNDGRSLPGPNPSFLGLVELIVYLKGSIVGLVKKYGHYGPVIRVYVGPFVWIIATDLQSYQNLLSKSKSFPRGKVQESGSILAPGALFVTEGVEWRRHRLAVSPFFAEEELEKYCSDILEIVKEEYDELENEKPFIVTELSSIMTSRILMKILFKVSINKKNSEELKRFNEAVNVMGDWLVVFVIFSMIFPALLRFSFVKNYLNQKKAPFRRIIKEMKESPNSDCLWKQLLNEKFTWEEFENESVGLMIAGFDTTTYALCWILHSLTKFPEAKLKLKQEIDSVLSGRLPTAKDLKHLPYLEKVIFETLRYHPIILNLSRTSREQDSIGDYQIPKNFSLFAALPIAIRNAVDNPDKFDPDRFNEENIRQLSRIAMGTFGWGPHQCVGKHLALLEMKLIIIYLFQNGDIEVDLTTDTFNPHYPLKAPKKLSAMKVKKSN